MPDVQSPQGKTSAMTTTVTPTEQTASLSTAVRESPTLPLLESDPSHGSSAPGGLGFTDGGAVRGEGRGRASEGARREARGPPHVSP